MADYAGMREPYAFIQQLTCLHNVERIRSIDNIVAPLDPRDDVTVVHPHCHCSRLSAIAFQ